MSNVIYATYSAVYESKCSISWKCITTHFGQRRREALKQLSCMRASLKRLPSDSQHSAHHSHYWQAWRWGLRSWHVGSRMVNLNGVQSSHSLLKLLGNYLSLNGRRVNFEICVGGFKEVSGGQLRHWRGANWQRWDKLCNLIVPQSNKGEGTNWSWKDWNTFYEHGQKFFINVCVSRRRIEFDAKQYLNSESCANVVILSGLWTGYHLNGAPQLWVPCEVNTCWLACPPFMLKP